MGVTSVATNSGFDTSNLWVDNLTGASSVQFSDVIGNTGNPVLGEQVITYSSFSFEKDGLTYTYTGSFTVTYDRGLVLGSVAASGTYDTVTVTSGTDVLATHEGAGLTVDFGQQVNLPLVDLLVDVVDLLIYTGLGTNPAGTNNAFDNLNYDSTPGVDALSFADSDTVNGGSGDDVLSGFGGSDQLFGGGGSDRLLGGAGADTLDGGTGIDTLLGGAGNDIYVVDNAGDRVVEAVGGGSDTVQTTVSYALDAGQAVEKLVIADPSGTAPLSLTGNEFGNELVGNAGNNVLDGGAGADILRGLDGDDTYYVNTAADQVFEASGGGDDTVIAMSSYRLQAGQAIETLQLVDPTAGFAFNLTGNAFANELTGNAGRNILDGGSTGNDVLHGLGGADRLIVHNSSTIADGGTGFDSLVVADNATVALTSGWFSGIEMMIVRSGATLDLSGLAATNGIRIQQSTNGQGAEIIGSQGVDHIKLSTGDAHVTGGNGDDFIQAGTGTDTFHFNDPGFGRDRITNADAAAHLTFDFAGLADDMSDLTITAINGGQDVQISVAGGIDGDAVVLKDFTIAQLMAKSDFLFV